ncbi:MAG: DUF5060 domain-containing protein [Planctomycetota bacterium]
MGAAAAMSLVLAPLAGGQTVVNLEDGRDAWKPIQINYTGTEGFSEFGNGTNPFLDRRLDVTFQREDDSGQAVGPAYVVPGFFNADGNALTTNASSGTQWAVRFTPNQAGTWRYTTSFRQGSDVAVADSPTAGTAGDNAINGTTGTFSVAPRDASAPGFLSKGRLAYVGEHYLQTQGDGKYFIKTGADSPENLLGYRGFDNTQTKGNAGAGRRGILHNFTGHVGDYNPGDPAWDTPDFDFGNTLSNGGDARNIIGKNNYLADVGVNSVYFLVNNVGGDGQDAHPFSRISTPAQLSGETNSGTPNDNLNYDVSKLEQWNTYFAHAQRQGIQLHMVLNEAENANKLELDDGTLGTERKLYYREMIARFGHHNALVLNISEEYDLNNGFGSSLSEEAARVNQFADHLATLDAYGIPTTVHQAQSNRFTSDPREGNSSYRFFIGDEDFDLTSIQRAGQEEGWSDVVEAFRNATADEGRKLAVNIDEPESITRIGVGTNDNTDPTGTTLAERFNTVRKTMTWDILLSGAAGVEWFIHDADQDVEDQRLYEQVYRETAIARRFLEEHTPFWEMTPNDDLVDGEDSDYGGAEVFAKPGEVYAIYLPDASNDDNNGGPPTLDLTGFDGDLFTLRWFNPRTGEFVGDPVELLGGGLVGLGLAPDDGTPITNDWVAFVTIPEPSTILLISPYVIALATGRRRPR